MIFDPAEHTLPYMSIHYHSDEDGYIVWRPGTGGNVELLHIEAFEVLRGHGTRLLRLMLERLRHAPPAHSIFGFTRVDNRPALAFYHARGFILSHVDEVYPEGHAILFSQGYRRLLEINGLAPLAPIMEHAPEPIPVTLLALTPEMEVNDGRDLPGEPG